MNVESLAPEGSLQEVRPGRSLHVATLDRGADTTLFFLHGAGGNKAQWRNQWAQFGQYNLVAWDAIGHGKSPQPRAPAAYQGAESLADSLALFARYRGTRNFLVAHSLGARLALAWLLQAPSGIDGVVLLGAAPIGPLSGSRRALFGGWLGRLPLPVLELLRPLLAYKFAKLAWGKQADPALVAHEQRAARNNKLFMMQALFAGAPEIDPHRLASLSLPIRILAGTADGLVPVAASQALAAQLPNATLTLLPGCGHQIMLEEPAATNTAISAALSSRTSQDGSVGG
jgi:pimeloyl-ACP methyl ester carboxylesterase